MIAWLGHAAFRISAEKRIYIDPINVKKDSLPADIILVSHRHPGHCSIEDIERIATPDTVIMGNRKSIDGLRGIAARLLAVCPGQSVAPDGIHVDVLPAYGTGHAQEEEGLGFVVAVAGQRIYHAGDTACIPEMQNIRCTVALLPVSGSAVPNAAEAVRAARLLHPRLAVPMHYGSRSGSIADAHAFLIGVAREGGQAKLLTPA